MNTNNEQAMNYKFAFICIVFSYLLLQVVIVLFTSDTINVRYYTLLEVLIFLIPVLIIGKDDLHFANNSSNQSILKYIINNYQIFINFKLITIPCILWALFGVLLFQIGSSVVIEKILPMQWLDYYNKMMEGVMLSQELMVLNSSNTILEFSQIVLFVSIIPAICEELLFRGYLMQSIRQLNSKSFAVIVSAFLFAAIHFNPIGFLPIFAIGIFLGGLFYATGSIVPCILFHILNNLIVIISSNYGRTDGLGYSVMSLWFGIFTFVLGVIIMLIAYNKTNKAGIK